MLQISTRVATSLIVVALVVEPGATPAQAPLVTQVPGDTGFVGRLVVVDDTLWVLAQNGVFRADGPQGPLIAVAPEAGGSFELVPIGRDLLAIGVNGTFRIEPQSNRATQIAGVSRTVTEAVVAGPLVAVFSDRQVFRIDLESHRSSRVETPPGIYISGAEAVGGEIWFDTFSGLYRLAPGGGRIDPVLSETSAGVTATGRAIQVGAEIWVPVSTAPRPGVLRIGTDSRLTPIAGDTGFVFWMIALDTDVFVSAEKGFFLIDRTTGNAHLIPGIPGAPYAMAIGGDAWINTDKGVLRVVRDTRSAELFQGTGKVLAGIALDRDVWLHAEQGIFYVDSSNRISRVTGLDVSSLGAVVRFNDDIYFSTDRGVFRGSRNDTRPTLIDGVSGAQVLVVGEDVWLNAIDGLYRFDRADNRAVLTKRATGTTIKAIVAAGALWLADIAVWRVDLRTALHVAISGEVPFLARVFGQPAWLEGTRQAVISYVDTQSGVHRRFPHGTVEVLYDSDRERLLARAKGDQRWRTVSAEDPLLIQLSPPSASLHFLLRDSWGNTSERSVRGAVLPTWTLTFLLPLGAVGLTLFSLAASPYSRYFHRLLMNPFLRNWGSFGTIPLLITLVAPVRRHFFRRYREQLAQAPRFAALYRRYVIPDPQFGAPQFGQTLSDQRIVGVQGQSGIGKSAFLTYIAYEIAAGQAGHPLLRQLIPVFVDLHIAGGLSPEHMVRAELRKYGDVTDEALASALMDDGGFVYLFDGLNEVGEQTRQAVLQFVDVHRNHSYSCLTAQVATDDVMRVCGVVLGSVSLRPDKVEECVRLAAKGGETSFDPAPLLDGFSAEHYDICSVPFQLELMIEMWRAVGRRPANVDDLYSFVIGPFVHKQRWAEQGLGDAPDALVALAFEMFVKRRPYDPKHDYLPTGMQSQLLARKLLVERGEVMEFRHDRVRAYLAARHFAGRWREILAESQVFVDSNWDAMLQFHVMASEDVQAARELVVELVKRDAKTALRVNQWGLTNRPSLFADWQPEFARAIGTTRA